MTEEIPRPVRYVLVVSAVVVTLHWESRVYQTHDRRERFLRGLPYSLFNAAFGWWGVPWGPVRTVQAFAANLSGVPAADSDRFRES